MVLCWSWTLLFSLSNPDWCCSALLFQGLGLRPVTPNSGYYGCTSNRKMHPTACREQRHHEATVWKSQKGLCWCFSDGSWRLRMSSLRRGKVKEKSSRSWIFYSVSLGSLTQLWIWDDSQTESWCSKAASFFCFCWHVETFDNGPLVPLKLLFYW